MVDTGGAQRHPVATANLIEWWERGAGAAKIRWGIPGDFDRCVRLAEEVFAKNGITSIDPKGFCSNRHVGATGARPGHAAGEQAGKH